MQAKTDKSSSTRGRAKFREGVVVSAKSEKTVIVAVVQRYKHPQYGKYVSKTNRYAVHDAKGEVREGDTVKIAETSPISKTKRWKVSEIISRGE